jgi:pilus assembly protein Flp/PilA
MLNRILKFKGFFSDLAKREEGVTAVEYALIAAGIAIAIVVVVGTLGNAISATFQSVVSKL